MVRNSQPWELGEPGLNDHGQPVMHNIAEKLGCLRTNSDVDLPIQFECPEHDAGVAEVARRLGEQKEQGLQNDVKDTDSSAYKRTERASSPELDHFTFELGYKEAVFGNNTIMAVWPQSSTSGNDFEFGNAIQLPFCWGQ